MAKLELKSCPFCGGTELYMGHSHAYGMGVKCVQCGGKIEREWPEEYPDGIDTLEALDAYVLTQAIEAWNRRPE